MREIKFRAWDEQGKIMHIPMTLSQIFQIGKTHEIAIMGLKFKLAFDNLTFMQFTGLKDKNGKERYQGDIIRRGSYVFVEEVKTFNLGPYGQAVAYGYSYMPEDEVIGNIYEHPELLSPAG